MELIDVINKRKSIRRFQDEEVPRELLEELLSLARKCPSAGAIRGFQGFITYEKLVYDAPIYVVICVDPTKYESRYGIRGRDLYAIQDATIFGAYFQLLLVDKGLASVWVGAFRESKIQRILGTNLRPVAILAIGLPYVLKEENPMPKVMVKKMKKVARKVKRPGSQKVLVKKMKLKWHLRPVADESTENV